MTFFTTPELLEIGDIPFACAGQKPTRQEALEYYRRVTEHFQLHVHQYQWVKTVTGKDGDFRVTATDRSGQDSRLSHEEGHRLDWLLRSGE